MALGMKKRLSVYEETHERSRASGLESASSARSISASSLYMWQLSRTRPARTDALTPARSRFLAAASVAASDTIAESPGSSPSPARRRLASARSCRWTCSIPTPTPSRRRSPRAPSATPGAGRAASAHPYGPHASPRSAGDRAVSCVAGTMASEHLHQIAPVLRHCQGVRGAPALAGLVRVGAMREKQLDDLDAGAAGDGGGDDADGPTKRSRRSSIETAEVDSVLPADPEAPSGASRFYRPRRFGSRGSAASQAAWPAGSGELTHCPTHSPVTCRVAALMRFQALIDAIATTSAASCDSS